MIRSKLQSVLVHVMIRRTLLGVVAIAGALAALLPAVALAGGFSSPVQLPSFSEGEYAWSFAVNDRGQAIAAASNRVYPVERSGRLGPPWPLTAPGGFPAGVGSIVLDDRGRIAAGLSYGDGSYVPEDSAHNSGCCAHVAVASWQLGAKPPLAQVLAPPTDHSSYQDDELGAPEVVIGPTAITALWSAGGFDPRGPPFEAHLDEAFGAFGQPLQAVQLMTVPRGIQTVHLSLAPNGNPVAAWRADANKLGTVEGLPTGELPSSSRVQRAPELSDTNEGEEFSSDLQGDTVFTYMTGSFGSHSQRVMAVTSTNGGPFGRPRVIAKTGPEANAPTVITGGHRSLLVFWSCIAETRACSSTWGRRVSIFGSLRTRFEIGDHPKGFIDSHGRTVIAYEGNSAVEAIISQPGKPFGAPHRISPSNRGCHLGLGEGSGQSPEPSRSGAAIFFYSCESTERQYLVRYTP